MDKLYTYTFARFAPFCAILMPLIVSSVITLLGWWCAAPARQICPRSQI